MIGKTHVRTMEKMLSMTTRERIDYAIANKNAILEQKKSAIIKSMPVSFRPSYIKSTTSKSDPFDPESLSVIQKTIVGNVCMYMDGHLDVQGEGCWKKSISESQAKFYHTQDHSSKVADRVGVPLKTYTDRIELKRLGFKSSNSIKDAEALLMDTSIYKDLDKKIFVQYGLDMIKQHSVGMVYYDIRMAVNEDSEDTRKEFKLYEKIYPRLINPEVADKYGMFFYVKESGLIEISAVTRGSNDLTPTFDSSKHEGPEQSTQEDVKTQTEAAKALQEKNKQNFYTNLL